MLTQALLVLFLSGASCQLQSFFAFPPVASLDPPIIPKSEDSSVCTSTETICYLGSIRLCKEKQLISESALVHTCSHGCSPCPDGPPLCNCAQGRSQCSAEHSLDVTECLENEAYCSEGNVRYCNSSKLSVLVEPCGALGCQSSPLSCRSATVRRVLQAKAKGKQGKRTAPTPAKSSNCAERVRSAWSSMPDADREKFVNGVLALYNKGDMQRFAQTHWDNRDLIHGTGILHFLIWHRVFLLDFEEKIRGIPGFECVTVPFWTYDFSTQANDRRSIFGTTSSRLGQADHEGCMGGVFAKVTHSLNGTASCVQRAPTIEMLTTLSGSVFADLTQVSQPSFQTFSDSVQNVHGLPHVAVGGNLATHYSPIDPLFFVHHSNVDRIFSIWQDCHQNYEWFEPQGLATPIIAYTGVTAGNFIDNSKISWQGKTINVSYANDALGDASQSSTDFRRRIATACQGGSLSRAPNAVSPILGIDNSWALSSGVSGGAAFTPQTKNVTITCQSDTGATEMARLPIPPLAVYDGLTFQECVGRCGNFYFKNSGASNCICTTAASSGVAFADFSASVNRYIASCGSGTTYGLFQLGGSAGRRLLQAGGFGMPGSMDMGSSTPMPMGGATMPMGGTTMPGATPITPMGGMTSPTQAMTGRMTPTRGKAGKTKKPTRSPTAAEETAPTPGNPDAPDAILAAGNTSESGNSTVFSITGGNMTVTNNVTSGNMTNSNQTSFNMTATNGTQTNATNLNSTQTNTTNSNSTNSNSSRVCFNAFAPPVETRAEVACSSKATTPPPLPAAWLTMNNLNAEFADNCKQFRPANLTKSFDCVQNQNS